MSADFQRWDLTLWGRSGEPLGAITGIDVDSVAGRVLDVQVHDARVHEVRSTCRGVARVNVYSRAADGVFVLFATIDGAT